MQKSTKGTSDTFFVLSLSLSPSTFTYFFLLMHFSTTGLTLTATTALFLLAGTTSALSSGYLPGSSYTAPCHQCLYEAATHTSHYCHPYRNDSAIKLPIDYQIDFTQQLCFCELAKNYTWAQPCANGVGPDTCDSAVVATVVEVYQVLNRTTSCGGDTSGPDLPLPPKATMDPNANGQLPSSAAEMSIHLTVRVALAAAAAVVGFGALL